MRHGSDDFFTDDRVESRGIDRRLLGRLLRYVLPHRRLLAAALAALLCGTACQLAGPYLIKIVIDRHVIPGQLDGMGRWVLLYLAALAGAMGFVYLQMYAVSILGQRVILALRREMFARMQRLPVVFFDRTPTGRLMTRLTSDVEALQELLSSGLVSTIGDAAVLAGTAAILLWMDVRLALVTFAVLPVLVLFVELLKKRIREANREMRRRLARMNAFLQEHVTGVAVVKAFGTEGKSTLRFDVLNGEYAAESVRLTNLYSIYFPGVEMLASIAVALLLWRGGVGLLSGALTFGTLVAFLEYARRFYEPIKDMSDKYNILQTALASSERIFRLLDEEISPEYAESLPEPAPDARPSPYQVPSGSGAVPAIEFRDVWFSYPRPADAGAGGGRRDHRSCAESLSSSRKGKPARSWGRRGRERRRSSRCCAASTRSAAGRSCSSGGTSARSRGRNCAGRSPSSSRTRSSSPARSGKTSRREARRSAPRCRRSAWNDSPGNGPRDWRRTSVSAGCGCRRGNARWCRSPARWPGSRASFCWTRRPPASIP